MGWIRCVRCEKLQRDFVGQTFALIAPVQYVLHQLSCTYEMIPNAPKYYETHRNISLRSEMGWIRCVCCEKLQRNFVARTFVLIAPIQYVLQQLSCTYETIPNAPKYYELHWIISLGSNGVDWVRSLQKIQTWHCGMNFCINWTCAVCFVTS
jgi:uncharacterized membrane protein